MPVERVRDVDEPALAADLGDRLLHRHPARDLLLDEEADHLALVGGLDLLGDDHLDAVLGGLLAGVQGAGDLVVVGHRDRAEADVARGRQQDVHGGRAVVGVVGVHVQVDLDQLALGEPGADLGLRVRVVALRGQALVDRLDVVGDLAPGELAARIARRARRAARAGVVAHDPLELLGQHADVAELEEQPEVALAQHLLVDRHTGRERDGSGAERLHEHAGRGDLAERGGDDDVRARRAPRPRRRRSARGCAGSSAASAPRRSSSRPPPPTAAPRAVAAARAGTAAARRAPRGRRTRSAPARPRAARRRVSLVTPGRSSS